MKIHQSKFDCLFNYETTHPSHTFINFLTYLDVKLAIQLGHQAELELDLSANYFLQIWLYKHKYISILFIRCLTMRISTCIQIYTILPSINNVRLPDVLISEEMLPMIDWNMNHAKGVEYLFETDKIKLRCNDLSYLLRSRKELDLTKRYLLYLISDKMHQYQYQQNWNMRYEIKNINTDEY